MRFDGLDADEETFGNFFDPLALPEQLEYFQLTISQDVSGAAAFDRRSAGHFAQDRRSHLFAHVNLTSKNTADRGDYVLRCLLLGQVSLRTSTECSLAIHRLLVHGQHQYRQLWVTLFKLFDEL